MFSLGLLAREHPPCCKRQGHGEDEPVAEDGKAEESAAAAEACHIKVHLLVIEDEEAQLGDRDPERHRRRIRRRRMLPRLGHS